MQQNSSVNGGGDGSAVAIASDWSGRVYLLEQAVADDDNEDSERSRSSGRCQLVSFWPNADAAYAESPLQTPAVAAKLWVREKKNEKWGFKLTTSFFFSRKKKRAE